MIEYKRCIICLDPEGAGPQGVQGGEAREDQGQERKGKLKESINIAYILLYVLKSISLTYANGPIEGLKRGNWSIIKMLRMSKQANV